MTGRQAAILIATGTAIAGFLAGATVQLGKHGHRVKQTRRDRPACDDEPYPA